MQVAIYLELISDAERTLASSLRTVADGHGAEADIRHLGQVLATQCDSHVDALAPLASRYGRQPDDEPERLAVQGLSEVRSGPVGLLRDLQDLHMLASFVEIIWAMLGQAARLLGTLNCSMWSAVARRRPRCSRSGCEPALRRPHRKR